MLVLNLVTLRSCSYSVSFLTLSMYFSIAVEAKGGDHVLLPWKGCSCEGGLFLK